MAHRFFTMDNRADQKPATCVCEWTNCTAVWSHLFCQCFPYPSVVWEQLKRRRQLHVSNVSSLLTDCLALWNNGLEAVIKHKQRIRCFLDCYILPDIENLQLITCKKCLVSSIPLTLAPTAECQPASFKTCITNGFAVPHPLHIWTHHVATWAHKLTIVFQCFYFNKGSLGIWLIMHPLRRFLWNRKHLASLSLDPSLLLHEENKDFSRLLWKLFWACLFYFFCCPVRTAGVPYV